MTEDIEKEDWRQYNTSKEFSKDIKFNKKWYHLTAIFDQDQDNFDFNAIPNSDDIFDFNDDILDQTNEYEPNQYIDSVKFDFNSVLMEKYKITEIGLIMSELNEGTKVNQNIKSYDITKITNNTEFINFYNAVNKHQFNGFYIKTSLDVFDSDSEESIASINDETKFKHDDISKTILSTLLKNAGGYANEATIQLLGDVKDDDTPKDYDKQNIVQLLSNLTLVNNINPMSFPDTMFEDGNEKIPVDLKVAYNGRISVASGRNIKFMSEIYHTLLAAIEKKQTLIDYIKSNNIENILPELKGFLLVSSTKYIPEHKRLEYTGLCIRPIIACMHGRRNVVNDPLFASKDGRGQGAISYDNGDDKEYNEKDSILNGCPLRFANVIKNFYQHIADGDLNIFNDESLNLLAFLKPEIREDNEKFIAELNLIYEAIGIKIQ